jgi:2-dehydro-3-deoxygluconokinase
MSEIDVVTVGETMLALRADGMLAHHGTVRTSIAGSESNVAIALARLGHTVEWVSRVGDDAAGRMIRRELRAEGVGQRWVSVDPSRSTGVIVFEQRLPEVKRVDYVRTGSAASALSVADLQAVASCAPRVLHVTGITCALGPTAAEAVSAAASSARSAGARIVLDVNFRRRLWTEEAAAHVLGRLVPRVDVVIGSADEIALLAGAAEERVAQSIVALLAAGPAEVVVKLGDGGAEAYTADGRWHDDARQVVSVDVVGAGDAFTAGYISGMLDGLPIPERLGRANLLGAYAVATHGDWEGLPERSELGLLGRHPGSVLR